MAKKNSVIAALFFILFFFTFFLQLSGCSWFELRSQELLTQSPNALPRSAQQQWQIDWKQQRYLLTVVSEVNQDKWQWVMLNSLGQRLITAQSDGKKIHLQHHQSHPITPLTLDLLGAWQYSFWPLADLQVLPNETSIITSEKGREVYSSGILSASIRYEVEVTPVDLWRVKLIYRHTTFTLFIESQPLN
jgi:Protein of unknown function (DUF3261)